MKKTKKLLLIIGLLFTASLALGVLGSCKKKDNVTYTFVGADIESVELEKGKEYNLPKPEMEGYDFLGWYTSEDFSGEPITKVMTDESKTYYAKWEQLCKIVLNLNGGTLEDTVIYVKAGVNVYEFMKDYKPTKTGMEFGAWFVGETNEELSSSVKSTKEGLTLSAKYKTPYTIELHLQNVDKTNYEEVKSIVAYEYAGKTVTAKHTLTGFKEVNKSETVKNKVISEDASKNVFVLYYDRETYRVTFNPNYPNGQAGTTHTESLVYGQSVDARVNYTTEGYCLMGWATSRSGDVAYKANYIDSVLHNKEGESQVDKITPTRDMTLYGVWAQGIPDMFGSDDFLYLFGDDAEVIYLCRGDVFFEGEYVADDKEFTFWVSENTVLLEGKINSNNTYTYYDSNRTATKTLYAWLADEEKMGLNEKVKIHFDAYDGITYSVADATGKTSNSEGTYIIDENGFYIATFTSGDMADKTLTITVGNAKSKEGNDIPAFRLRNDEEYKLGSISHLDIQNNRLVLDEKAAIKLDGFGDATINGKTYNYTMDEVSNVITLKDSYGNTVDVLRLITENGLKGYTSYREELNKTFTLASGATLQLDGMFKAKYVGATTVNAYYTIKTSVFGGYIVAMTDAEEHTFLLVELPKDENDENAVTEYSVEKRVAGYAEYYYKDKDGTYYAPLLVVNESEDVDASLYAYTNAKTYVKVSSGSLEKNKDTGLYLYTVLETFDAEGAIKDPFDLKKIQAFTCALDSTLTSYQINFWYSYKLENEAANTVLSKTYTASNGATLTLVGGFAIFNENTNITTGVYYERDGYIQVSMVNGTRYVELSGDAFVVMNYAPFTAYLMNADGTISTKEYVEFDGKGGATYKKEDANGDVIETHIGIVETLSQTTLFGATKMQFNATEKTFVFLQLSAGTRSVLAIENAELQGEFLSSEGTLKLDGFSFEASLINNNGETLEGRYWLEGELLVFSAGDTAIRFEKNGNEFTALGMEYGEYQLIQNQADTSLWIALDGKGGLTVYKKAANGDKTVVAEDETYTVDGVEVVLSYEFAGKAVKGVIENGNFLCRNIQAGRTLVIEEDWSVLILDDYGNATKYNKAGKKFVGTYTLITDTLFSFASKDGAEENLYEYNAGTDIWKAVDRTEQIYCTKDLETLHFKSSGFAVFNGKDNYYYNVVNSKVIIYRPEIGAGMYGFVAEEFGEFALEQTWDTKTYYMTSGGNVTFKRDSATDTEYGTAGKLTDLSFTPQGNGEFEVLGYATVDGRQKTCTVVRKMEGDRVDMHIVVGNYYYGIEVAYAGDSEDGVNRNSYKITSLSWVMEAPSYAYMDTLYMLYSWYGSAAASYQNNIGVLKLTREYNADGTEKEQGFYLTGKFGEGSKMYDTTGKIITFEKATLSLNEDTNIYTAQFEKDGYTYAIHFQLARHGAFGVNGYRLYAFTRQEKVPETANGYTVYASRVIATETTVYSVGSIYSVALYKGDEQLDGSNLYLAANNNVYFVVRTKEGNLNKTATYYTISLVEKELGSVDENTTIIPTYESATVEVSQVKTVYNEAGTDFVDIDEATNTIKVIYINNRSYVVSSCQYADGVYTAKTVSGKTFTVSVAADKAVITEIEE